VTFIGLLLITPGIDGRHGRVLSTLTDSCRPLIVLRVQLCVQRDSILGMRQCRAVHWHQLIYLL